MLTKFIILYGDNNSKKKSIFYIMLKRGYLPFRIRKIRKLENLNDEIKQIILNKVKSKRGYVFMGKIDDIFTIHRVFQKRPSYLGILTESPTNYLEGLMAKRKIKFPKNIIKIPYIEAKDYLEKTCTKILDDIENRSDDNTFLSTCVEVAYSASNNTNCIKRRVGAVIADLKDKKIFSIGWNGTPNGIDHCRDGGCIRCSLVSSGKGNDRNKCVCIHAEEKALMNLNKMPKNANGKISLITTLLPCIACSSRIIESNIKEVYYKESFYDNKLALKYFKNANVQVYKLIKKLNYWSI